MVTTKTRKFEPNAVYIPAAAIWRDREGCHADPTKCTLLFLDGDRHSGDLYSEDSWKRAKPIYTLHDEQYWMVPVLGEEETPMFPAGLSINDNYPEVGDRIQLLPEMYVVKEDETMYWDREWVQRMKVKRIFGVYVFNKRKAVHLCELTPSYERVFMGSQWQGKRGFDYDDDELCEEISSEILRADSSCEMYSYMHCSDVETVLETRIREGRFPPRGKSGGYRITGLTSVTEEDAIAEIREYAQNCDL